MLDERWKTTWASFGKPSPTRTFDRLVAAYGEPHRAYHTLQHLGECFANLDLFRAAARRAGEIELALWFHDAVYDTHAHDNEERSAAWAKADLFDASLGLETIERIAAMIVATKHAAEPTDPDAKLCVDVDLAILAAPRERFDEYEAEVRREYAWVDDDAFAAGRAQVLESFLRRGRIYATEIAAARFEEKARANLRRSLTKLRS
jgi:predicted metal-dependent HD superfamily phosphohydrolase